MRIEIKAYPDLRFVCWSQPADAVIEGAEALAIYERNWRHVDQDALTDAERALIDTLVKVYGNGVLPV
jgi:hypothetical protein